MSINDITNSPQEKLKRVNEILNDVEYVVFKERINIRQHYLAFVKKQQDELKALYEKKMLYERESEEIFINSTRESNQSQEKLTLLQVKLLDELKQKLAEILKSLENKIDNLSTSHQT